MKLITFVIPCFNSQDYMEKCVDSILSAGDDDVEVIIVDDGSSDSTASIADGYERRFPGVVRAVHQTNGGHGKGVNTGLEKATGEYFKVVDSDDWLNTGALRTTLTALRMLKDSELPLDLLVTNYVYEHVEDGSQKVINYVGIIPENRVIGWDDFKHVDPARYLIMHSMIYRTAVLRECGLRLPEHTFYVDNLVAYVPLPYVRRIYYLNVDLYRYFIGRADQSVNEQVMVSRIDQQIRVNNIMRDACDLNEVRAISPKLARFMTHYLSMIYTITATMLALDKSPDAEQKRRELWQGLKKRDIILYRRIRYLSKSFFMSMPGKTGKRVSETLYRIVRRFYKFN